MPQELNASRAQLARDQLFLDTASGVRLSNIARTIGMRRPGLGLANDAEFRHMVKRVAFRPKLVREAFRRIMEVCFGPQFGRARNLSSAVAEGAYTLNVTDASAFTQQGTIVLSPGTAIEESRRFIFRSVNDNTITLNAPTQYPHAVVADASSRVIQWLPVTSTLIPLISTADFPTTGYPYPILLDEGTEQEEILLVTNNNTGTNVLTTLTGTTVDHFGPRSEFFVGRLGQESVAGRYFIKLAGSDPLEGFPAWGTGWVRIGVGTANEEVVEFSRIEPSTGTVYLATALTQTNPLNELVEIVRPGALVRTASVLQAGTHWDVFHAEPYRVVLYIPEAIRPMTIRDASWLHGAKIDPAPAATTTAAPVGASDMTISCVATSAFATSGLFRINGVQTFFALNDPDTNTLTLARALGASYLAGVSIAVVEPAYGGTDLMDGNPRDLTTGAFETDQFPGHYVYNPGEYAPSATATTLAERLTPPTRVAETQTAGATCLEVADASRWPVAPFTPFDVVVGRLSGDAETRSLTDVTLRLGLSTTTIAPGVGYNNAGDTELRVVASGSFPDTGVSSAPAGFRLIIDRGGANEEIVRVNDNNTGGNLFTLLAPLTINHLIGETVELVNDVLTFGSEFVVAHAGPSWTPTREGQTVERPYEELSVADGSAFPTTESTVWLNFGKGRLDARSKLVTIVGPAIYALESTADFPTTDYPYPVVTGQGTVNEQTVFVTNNNTGTNRLTFSAAPTLTPDVGSYVLFESGAPEALTYTSREGNVLSFDEAIYPSPHMVGETVILSPGDSTPRDDAWTFQFFLPPDPALCLRSVLDLVRAAGVRVDVTTER